LRKIYADSLENILQNRLKNTRVIMREYFPEFLVFIESTEQQKSRPVDKKRKKYIVQEKRKT